MKLLHINSPNGLEKECQCFISLFEHLKKKSLDNRLQIDDDFINSAAIEMGYKSSTIHKVISDLKTKGFITVIIKKNNLMRRRCYHVGRPGTKEYVKSAYLKHAYNITIEQLKQLYNDQNNCCAICGVSEKDCKRSLHVDHCHQTKRIRGLLCNTCNTSLGGFKDKIENLESAIKYLKANYLFVNSELIEK